MENLRGAALMVAAMFCFAVEDAFIKILAERIPAGQILGIICLGGLCGLIGWSLLRGLPLWQRAYLDPKVLIRTVAEIVGSCFFVSALALIPLTTASAVVQATPLVVAVGASLFLGQAMGWRRWAAVGIGFLGVLLILRPGMEGFVPATLLAVGGMLGLAVRDIVTRGITVQITGAGLGIHAFALLAPAAFLIVPLQGQSFVTPNQGEWLLFAIAIAIAILAYLTIVAATRIGHAGMISSFRYSRMVFALIIGALVFGENPDAPTLIGVAIIVGSGGYMLWREARVARASQPQDPAL